MFVKYGKEFEELCRRTGHEELAAEAEKQSMRCIRQFWMQDGMENGSFVHMMRSPKKLDQKSVRKEKSLLNPQGFCVMAGIGKEEGLAEKALDSVHERLETKYGVMILQPAYTRYHLELGEITSYPPGYKRKCRYLLP